MQCPNCPSILCSVSYEGIEIETCPSCEGEWLDADELGKIVRRREVVFTDEERRAIAESTSITGVVVAEVDRDLPCPKCNGTTDAVNYGGDTGIIIDRCTECGGFWLDKDELENIQCLVEGWKDKLPEDLDKYSQMLHDVVEKQNEESGERLSKSRVVNVLMRGVLNFVVK